MQHTHNLTDNVVVLYNPPDTPFFVEEEISDTFAHSLYQYTIAKNAPLLNICPNGSRLLKSSNENRPYGLSPVN